MAKKSGVRRIKHNGGLKALVKRIDAAGDLVAAAGVMGPKGQAPHGGLTNAQVGALHEYGFSFTAANGRRITVPARSFIRVPIRNARPEIKRALQRGAAIVVRGDADARQALEPVALKMQGTMQKAMSAGLEPQLAESTIERRKKPRKGHKGPRVIKPLIDTGQLRSSITSTVRRRGSSS